MDSIDKKILNIIQTKFPIIQKPYEAIGQEVGVSEKDVITRIGNLKKEGIIRRIGATFDPEEVGGGEGSGLLSCHLPISSS